MTASAILRSNLLNNPGFEEELDYWITDNAVIRSTDPPPYKGTAYLFGADDGSGTSYTYQALDLSAKGFTASQIASGSLVVNYGGWQSGWHYQTDSGKIEVIVKDTTGSVLYKEDLGWFYSDNTWTLMQGSFTLPVAATQITFGFYAEREDSFWNWNTDGYLDEAFIVITSSIKGDSGANNLLGTPLSDDIFGYGDDDTLHGGNGDDSMFGGQGNDTYFVENSSDIVTEFKLEGADVVYSRVSYTLSANVETLSLTGAAAINGTGNSLPNILTGNAVANELKGLGDNDFLAGLGGEDTLVGGRGKDTLRGGAGNDAFKFNAASESPAGEPDVITDFGVGDKIHLSSIDSNTTVAKKQAFTLIGGTRFTAPGQVRYDPVTRLLYCNTNADLQSSEFVIEVKGPARPAIATASEFESNDSSASANQVALHTAVRGSLLSDIDADWYKVYLSTPSMLSVVFDAPGDSSSPERFKISLYDLNKTLLNSWVAAGDNIFGFGVAQAGRYYIRVGSAAHYDSRQYSVMVTSPRLTVDDFTGLSTTYSSVMTGQHLLALIQAHEGDRYVNRVVDYFDPLEAGPWDCAELVSWGIRQAYDKKLGINSGGEAEAKQFVNDLDVVDSSRTLTEIGSAQATHTSGALLFSKEHVGVSDGAGNLFGAQSKPYGVASLPFTSNWFPGAYRAALVNDVSYLSVGTVRADDFKGANGDDTLKGLGGDDSLVGNAGNDILVGGADADTLMGGEGADRFKFVTTGEGLDSITDFASGTDKIQVVSANFGGLPAGTLLAGNFRLAGQALPGTPVFIYDAATGRLSFDADGSGTTTAGVGLATLTASTTLVRSDIAIVNA